MLGYIREIFKFLQGVAYDSFSVVEFFGYAVRFIGDGVGYASDFISSLSLPSWMVSLFSVSFGLALIKKIWGH